MEIITCHTVYHISRRKAERRKAFFIRKGGHRECKSTMPLSARNSLMYGKYTAISIIQTVPYKTARRLYSSPVLFVWFDGGSFFSEPFSFASHSQNQSIQGWNSCNVTENYISYYQTSNILINLFWDTCMALVSM